MTKYKTVEGHDIVAAKCYELRDGTQIFITRLDPLDEYSKPILFATVGYDSCRRARRLGDYNDDAKSHPYDIMRPWKTPTQEFQEGIAKIVKDAEKPKKQTLKQFISDLWGDDLSNLSVPVLVCLIDDFEKQDETS